MKGTLRSAFFLQKYVKSFLNVLTMGYQSDNISISKGGYKVEERLNIRVSKEFKQLAQEKAKDKGFTSVSQYIKYLVANDKEKKNGRN